ncbi:MAG: diaminopimelate decarboxylase, partial [Bacteroidota bacterium]
MNTIAGHDIKLLANQFGTPLFIYDGNRITENFLQLLNTYKAYHANTAVHYSVKANSNLFILSILEKLGAGVDTSSPFEVALARKAGFPDERILYTGNYESHQDLALLNDTDITVNLDDLASFNRLCQNGIPKRISFRINPGIGRGGFEGITTAGTDAKFGIPYEKAFDAYQTAQNAGVKRFGIHMMTGSNNLEPYHFAEVTEKLMKIAGTIFNRLGTS